MNTLPANAASAEPFKTVVFQEGVGGYASYRIPALVTAANGDLLAFAEGRVAGTSDTGDIDLVLRRSSDGGATWSPMQVVGDLGTDTYGNPVPIVAADGVIHLLTTSNKGRDHKHGIRDGKSIDIRRVHYQRSDDHGKTWTEPREITEQARKAGEDWRWYATGPGHGIQLARGEHAGRLVAAANRTDHSFRPDATGSDTNAAHILYSDDAGKTWHVGGEIHTTSPTIRPHESTVVELNDGRLYFNFRNDAAKNQPRAAAYSNDGGETLGEPVLVPELIEPKLDGVEGSILRYSTKDRGDEPNRIVFANPASRTARERLTVRSSFDEAKTWTAGRVLHEGPSGYSDLARLRSREIGILYEAGETDYRERIEFARFTPEWLDDGKLNASPGSR